MEPIPHTPKSLRARLGMKVRDVAEAAGVSLRCIVNLEAGNGATVETVTRVAKVLGVDRETLIVAIETEHARRAAKGAA